MYQILLDIKRKDNLLWGYLFFCFLLSSSIQAQEDQETTSLLLSGTVTLSDSNQSIYGVSVTVADLSLGVVTDQEGFYEILLPVGTHKVEVSYSGYKTQTRSFEVSQQFVKIQNWNVALKPLANQLQELVLQQETDKSATQRVQMSVNTLDSETIKEIPTILGESDLLKSLVLLPGVSTATETSSGFNVRGGASDQNLILVDKGQLYDSSHLFGLFSAFNPDVVKSLQLYKGGIPAYYGSRVSSVLDVKQKTPSLQKLKIEGGIGLIASRLLLETPIKKDKSTFFIAGRSSYAHIFLPLFDLDNKAYFYDFNAKFHFKLNEKHHFDITAYQGTDLFSLPSLFKNQYGSRFITTQWHTDWSPNLQGTLSMAYNRYLYELAIDFVGFEWESGINSFTAAYQLHQEFSDGFALDYGLENIYYHFNPGHISPSRADSGVVDFKLTQKYANESAIYVQASQQLSQKLDIQYGLRWSYFMRLGQSINLYQDDTSVIYDQIYKSATPIGTLEESRSDVMADFNTFEPRFAIAYTPNEYTAWKLSYNRMSQYVHVLSNTNAPTPADVWTPSGKYIDPQRLHQYALGYNYDFDLKDTPFRLETELYYKTVSNRIDYINGADLIANNAIEQVVLSGEARAYGLEFYLQKPKGVLTGFLSYTIGNSQQRTAARNDLETGINNGNWYSTPYNKIHDVALNLNYKLSEKWKFGANWIFQSGLPITYPTGQYQYLGMSIPVFDTDRNSDRLPNYHRLDISATLTPEKNASRKFQSYWVFGIYNLYNRMNANSVRFAQNLSTGQNEALQTSIFGIVPAVTYNFKF